MPVAFTLALRTVLRGAGVACDEDNGAIGAIEALVAVGAAPLHAAVNLHRSSARTAGPFISGTAGTY
jgi:hypothetical protein